MRLGKMGAPLAGAVLFVLSGLAMAQGPKPRLAVAINAGDRTILPGTRQMQASVAVDQGALPAGTPIKGITLVFNRSAAQQADLDGLLAAQQDTTSTLYHQWLTPDQFSARFGMAQADLDKVQAWLGSSGFIVQGVSRSRDSIVFDGTAGQVAAAFDTELHRYAVGDRKHFAPNSDLSLPAAIAPLVTAVRRLSDFHPRRLSKLLPQAVAKPAYTSAQTGNHFLTPADLATMYDLASTYKAGYTGTGQSVAIIGQSYVTTAPVASFEANIGSVGGSPILVLVPQTGVAAINPQGDGDEGESQLDLEYAGGMAPGAAIYFVYTGDNANASVFDSLAYAVDEDLASIISGSYGLCEAEVNQAEANSFASLVQQANVQGQTVIFSAGDSGSTSCSGYPNLSTTAQEALAVTFPASVPAVSAMGGLQMAAGTFAAGNTQYWQSATGTDVVSSLLSYVPETVWNEDSSTSGILSGGGGTSSLYLRPSWQANVPGIPSGTFRLVPDLSLQASTGSPGFVYCTSDPSDLANEGVTASCTNGLRGPSGTFFVAGGTSFAAPTFAGMLAVLNQAVHATGQGNINSTLYALASNSSVFSSAFHDATTGTNACTAGASLCSAAGLSQYAATTGYDQASGLGSIDFAQLLAAWPRTSASSLQATTISFNSGNPGQIAIFVNASASTPTGSVSVSLDGAVVNPALPLSQGMATYTYTFQNNATASHIVAVTYSGDATHAPSQADVVFSPPSPFATGTFSLAAQTISLPFNSTASGSFTITPSAGYTGTVMLSLAYPTTAPTLCYLVNPNSAASNVATPDATPVTATLLIGEGTACGTSATGAVVFNKGHGTASVQDGPPKVPRRRWPEGVAFAGLMAAGLAFRRSRRLPTLLSIALLGVVGSALNGCGAGSGSSTVNPPVQAQPQTVTVTLSGTDSVNTSISSSTTFSVAIH